MYTTPDLLLEIDQLLAQRNIEFLVDDEMRAFLYDGVPVTAGVLSDGERRIVAVGAVVVSHVEAVSALKRERLLARLGRLQKDFPLAMLKFTEENSVVWTFRSIEPEDFTPEALVEELDEATKTAREIGPQVCGRLATGRLGAESGVVGLEPPAPPRSRQQVGPEQLLKRWWTETLMTHIAESGAPWQTDEEEDHPDNA